MNTPRRHFIYAMTALFGALALAGCQRKAVKFNAVDITGADYGVSLKMLRDPAGKSRSVADFKGQVLAVFFGFTNCPDVCPTTLSKLKEIKNRLGKDSDRLAVIFVTVDPERDAPQRLAPYTAAFDPAFVPLHGDLASVTAVTKEFKAFFEKIGDVASGKYMVNHTAGIYLFDLLGRIRLFSRHDDTLDQVLTDVKTLLDNN